jgi:hypothetical protein
MKKFIFTSVLAFLMISGNALSAQNHPDGFLGLPGDNLNLFAVMNLFQESETLEAFEKSLNDPNTLINNLDLNGDNFVDYIMVHDYVEGNVHNIVLRVALNRYEFQDVAVFTVERFRNGSVQVQLIGDEALYGPNYIIEPNYAERPNPGYRGNVVQQQIPAPKNVTVVRTTYYDVARWPVIVYMSRPSYRPWRSVWYWGYTPVYWTPWTPHYWHFYYGYHSQWTPHYVTYYRTWHSPRSVSYRTVYYTRIRTYSPTVVVNVNKGVYKNTYSRPEKRTEGEVYYSQRRAVGTRVPSSTSNDKSTETVTQSSAASGTNTRVSGSTDTRNTSTVNNPRSAATTRPTTDVARDKNQTAAPTPSRGRVADSPTNNTKATPETPSRSNVRNETASPPRATTSPSRTTTTTAPRSASQPSGSQATSPSRTTESSAAPARTVQQPSPASSRPAVQSTPAPASSRPAVRSTPAPASSRPAVRSTPSTSSSDAAKSSPAVTAQPSRSTNQGTTRVSPSRESSRQSAPAVRSTRESSRQSSPAVSNDRSNTRDSRSPARSGSRRPEK